MKNIEELKNLLANSESDQVIAATQEWIASEKKDDLATVFYLRGNAFRQKENWREAMNCYLRAVELDPHGPGVEAYEMAKRILDYYNKDYYNP